MKKPAYLAGFFASGFPLGVGLGVGGDDATLRSAASNRSSESSQPSSRAASRNFATCSDPSAWGLRTAMYLIFLDESGIFNTEKTDLFEGY